MSYAKHVGRVGALGVALGVGLGVAGTQAVAWAEPADSGSSSQSSSSSLSGDSTSSGDSSSSSSGPASSRPSRSGAADGPGNDGPSSSRGDSSPGVENSNPPTRPGGVDSETDDSATIDTDDADSSGSAPRDQDSLADDGESDDTGTEGIPEVVVEEPVEEQPATVSPIESSGSDRGTPGLSRRAQPRAVSLPESIAVERPASVPEPTVDIAETTEHLPVPDSQTRNPLRQTIAAVPTVAGLLPAIQSGIGQALPDIAAASVVTAPTQSVAATSVLAKVVAALLAPGAENSLSSSLLWAAAAGAMRRETEAALTGATVAATGVNSVPVAGDDSATVAEAGSVAIDLLANDKDPDGTINPESIEILSGPAHGTLTYTGTGIVTYKSNGAEVTSDSFVYRVRDNNNAASNLATATIRIIPINDAPVARDDAATVAEGGSVDIAVLANDRDPDSTLGSGSIVILQKPKYGELTVSNGKVKYVNNGAEAAGDSFTYVLRDQHLAFSNIATVTIGITPVNDAPEARANHATVAEGGSVVIDVLLNDSDVDGTIDRRSIRVHTPPAHGQLNFNLDGTVEYVSFGTEAREDFFTYSVLDNKGAPSNVALVTLGITAVNDAPIAVDDTAFVGPGGSVVIPVTLNDADPDSSIDPASVQFVYRPLHGTAAINADGTITYTADGDPAVSSVSFAYSVADDDGARSDLAFVTVIIAGVGPADPMNSAPLAGNDVESVDEGGSVIIDVLANDSDGDGSIDRSSIVITHEPSHGRVSVNDDGTVTYFANDDAGTTAPVIADGFSYTVKDNSGATSNEANVAITVRPVNDPPVVTDDTARVDEKGTTVISVLENDGDPAFLDPASVQIELQPAHGRASVNSDGTITYTQTHPGSTADSFSYTVADNEGARSAHATVTVNIGPPSVELNTPPLARPDHALLLEGGTTSIAVLANDADADGTLDPTSIVITRLPQHGQVSVGNNGIVTYVADADAEARSDTFSYTVKDSKGATSNAADVVLTIIPVNDAPIAEDDVVYIAPGARAVFQVVANDHDADSPIKPKVWLRSSENLGHGTLTGNDDGTVTYIPDGSPTTTHGTFTYVIQDVNDAISNEATVTVWFITGIEL